MNRIISQVNDDSVFFGVLDVYEFHGRRVVHGKRITQERMKNVTIKDEREVNTRVNRKGVLLVITESGETIYSEVLTQMTETSSIEAHVKTRVNAPIN